MQRLSTHFHQLLDPLHTISCWYLSSMCIVAVLWLCLLMRANDRRWSRSLPRGGNASFPNPLNSRDDGRRSRSPPRGGSASFGGHSFGGPPGRDARNSGRDGARTPPLPQGFKFLQKPDQQPTRIPRSRPVLFDLDPKTPSAQFAVGRTCSHSH